MKSYRKTSLASAAVLLTGFIGLASTAPASAVEVTFAERGVPDVILSPSEQGAAAAGLAGTIGSAICAGSGGFGCVPAAGLATTAVAIATASGTCPDGQDLIIRPTLLQSSCIE